MSFIAVPPASPEEEPIDCGHFLPAIHPVDARARMRLDGTVTPERLRTALVEAALSVHDELAGWINAQVAAGHEQLADVPARQIDGESAHVLRFHRAVRCLATANLVERYRSFDSTADGHQRADALDPTVDDLRRDARWAIRDILGERRTTVELI